MVDACQLIVCFQNIVIIDQVHKHVILHVKIKLQASYSRRQVEEGASHVTVAVKSRGALSYSQDNSLPTGELG